MIEFFFWSQYLLQLKTVLGPMNYDDYGHCIAIVKACADEPLEELERKIEKERVLLKGLLFFLHVRQGARHIFTVGLL